MRPTEFLSGSVFFANAPKPTANRRSSAFAARRTVSRSVSRTRDESDNTEFDIDAADAILERERRALLVRRWPHQP